MRHYIIMELLKREERQSFLYNHHDSQCMIHGSPFRGNPLQTNSNNGEPFYVGLGCVCLFMCGQNNSILLFTVEQNSSTEFLTRM